MRSLAFKLTIAFLFVGLTGAFLVAFFVRQRTQHEFDQLILNQYQQGLIANLTQYYQENGSWNGVETIFRPGDNRGPFPHDAPSRWEARRALFALANADGVIVFGGGPNDLGRKFSQRDLNSGVPLEVNGRTVGWLLFTPILDRWRPGTPEGNFLLGVNQATLLSAIGATLVALILGGILAYSFFARIDRRHPGSGEG
jgi:hypothetical protein